MDEKKVRKAIQMLRIEKKECKKLLDFHGNKQWNSGILRRKIEDCNTAIEALEKQLPKKVEIEAWCPSCCPSCGYELSEDLGDGYYKHPNFIKRCPNPDCAQRLDWSE